MVCVFASVAVWLGCRDDLGVESQWAIGSGGVDAAPVDAPIDAFGSAIDAAIDAGSAIDARIDAGSAIDAGPIDAGPIDAGPIDARPIDAAIDAGGIGGPAQDASGPDGGRGTEVGALDRTSFYACAGGGCGSATGTGAWLPIAVAVGLTLRRRRRAAVA